MQEKNLRFVAEILVEKFSRPEEFFIWLNSGMRAIILNGTQPAKAFEFARGIIGNDPDSWQKEVVYVAEQLGDRLPSFHFAITECLRVIEPDPMANDPSTNNGQNLESLAIALLSLVRQLKVSSALKLIEGLIHTKLRHSQAVYDAALLTWRIMANHDSETDWISVFYRTKPAESRFRNQYSSILSFGMCVARPGQTEKFLRNWPPLQNYLESLEADASAESRVISEKIVVAIAAVLSEHGALNGKFFAKSDIYIAEVSGHPLQWGWGLEESAKAATQCRRQLPRRSRPSISTSPLDFV